MRNLVRETQAKGNYVGSPWNYTGGKYKLLPQIMPMIPGSISTFVDLFSGGSVVAANVDADKVIINDLLGEVVEGTKAMVERDTDEFVNAVKAVQEQFGVTKSNKEGYLALRDFYNVGNRQPEVFMALVSASFSNQIRFNGEGKFNTPSGVRKEHKIDKINTPYGKRMFNPRQEQKLRAFTSELKSKDVAFTSTDFENFDFSTLDSNSFVYLDPPYLITDATYNKSWTEYHERRLYDVMDKLTQMGIKFALSNVTHNKGRANEMLIEWSKQYYVTNLTHNYKNCSYQGRNKDAKCQEVLITNYDPTTFEIIQMGMAA